MEVSGKVKRPRSSNVATSLVKNSKSAFILAIEIHNKPVCEYRLQSVVIFMIHAWELLLKAYCYKHLKDKKILQKDGDNRYPQLSQIIERIYHTNTGKFRILRENVETLNEYRNLIVHAYGFENMDQLIFEFVVKSVLLYRDFIREYFSSHDLEGIADTPILPIAFKLPYTPIDILTHNFASANTSKEVLNFIDSIKSRINGMTKEGIEESIFISIRTEFINENNMKNSDISALISKDGIQFQKETKNKLVSDKGAQPMRGLLTKEEREEQFPISTKKNLREMVRRAVGDKWTQKGGGDPFFNQITKDLEAQYEGSQWYPNVGGNGGKRYTDNFYDLVMAKYE